MPIETNDTHGDVRRTAMAETGTIVRVATIRLTVNAGGVTATAGLTRAAFEVWRRPFSRN
jgi:hypothetical protein